MEASLKGKDVPLWRATLVARCRIGAGYAQCCACATDVAWEVRGFTFALGPPTLVAGSGAPASGAGTRICDGAGGGRRTFVVGKLWGSSVCGRHDGYTMWN